MTVLGFVLFGSLVMLPLFLQTVLGYPALQAGITMAPRGIGSFLAMPLVGILMSKLDPRKMLAAGLVIAGVTLYMLADINLNAGYWDIFWPQLLQGSAMGLLFIPLSTMSMASIPREKMGNATSLFNLMRNLGGGLGIAFVATSVSRSVTVHSAILSDRVNPYSPESQAAVNGARSVHGAWFGLEHRDQPGLRSLNGMIHQQAAMIAFIDIVRLLAAIFILVIPLVFIMRRPRGAASPPPGAH
jgi:Sugar phosphate permease